MDKRNEVTLNGKRYMVQGTAVCVYCESKVAWRSGWRAVRSAKIAAEVLLEQRVNAHYLNAVKALDAIAKLQAIAQAQGEYA